MYVLVNPSPVLNYKEFIRIRLQAIIKVFFYKQYNQNNAIIM